MADDATRSRLGRGLASLIGDVGQEPQSHDRASKQRRVPIEFVHANPNNPRKSFSEAELEDLSASIRERGVIQPVVVRARGGDNYEIIAGERRWRAAQRAGLHELPIVVLDVSDAEALELAIIENVQRSDLNPMEEATGYVALMEQHKHTPDDVAKIVGKSRSHVANMVRLTKLPDLVQQLVRAGKLSAGHARALIGQPNAIELAHDIIKRGLNVRQVEEMTRPAAASSAPPAQRAAGATKDADTLDLESRLTNALGFVVSIDHKASGKGTLHVNYRNLDQLDEVVRRLEAGPKIAGTPRIRTI